MFEFRFDEASGILRVVVLGTWTRAEIERYGREAGEQFADARRRSGALRLLIDCTAGYVCPRDLVEALAHAGLQHRQEGDLAAMVASSGIVKLQIKRMMGKVPADMFVDDRAARAWLIAGGGEATSETVAA
jgi:hypothetical protein